jgi:hypothetical protein
VTIRVDDQDVPRLVQKWHYGSAYDFVVTLCNGDEIHLDIGEVRDASCRGYQRWNADTDQMAVDAFVASYMEAYFR